MKYTFQMRDAYGDDYQLTVEANSEEEAWNTAVDIDDDAVPDSLVKVA